MSAIWSKRDLQKNIKNKKKNFFFPLCYHSHYIFDRYIYINHIVIISMRYIMSIKTKGKSTPSVSSWWEERRKLLASNNKPARAKPRPVKAKSKPVRAKSRTVKAKSKPSRAKPGIIKAKLSAKARTASKKKKIVKIVSKVRKAILTKKAKKRWSEPPSGKPGWTSSLPGGMPLKGSSCCFFLIP